MPDLTIRLEREVRSDDEDLDNQEDGEEEKLEKQSQWEDEDSKSFYLHLIDIKAIIPGILLENTKADDKKSSESQASSIDKSTKVGDTTKLEQEQLESIVDLEALDAEDAIDPSSFGDDQEGIEDL